MRRQFDLPEEDADYLGGLGLPWETIVDQGSPRLLIHEHLVPKGYNHNKATAALRITAYPPGIIDMVYFSPALARADDKPIVALTSTQIDGKPFQQWSRHYPWIDGEDSLATHLARVTWWLRDEFNKR